MEWRPKRFDLLRIGFRGIVEYLVLSSQVIEAIACFGTCIKIRTILAGALRNDIVDILGQLGERVDSVIMDGQC